jgi:hypothetical protein
MHKFISLMGKHHHVYCNKLKYSLNNKIKERMYASIDTDDELSLFEK